MFRLGALYFKQINLSLQYQFIINMDILSNIEQGFSASASIKAQLENRVLVPLVTNLDGFNNPKSFGVYKQSGGNPLGVVGNDYQPIDLTRFYETIEQSIFECGLDLNFNEIKYIEHKDGAKVHFEIPLKSVRLKTSLSKPDIIDTKLMFNTGFDGLTKTSLNLFTYRLVCSNGMKAWKKDIALSFKNTKGNNGKELLLCNEIFKAIENNDNHIELLNHLATINVTKAQVKEFVSKLTTYDLATESTRQKNILDKLLCDIETEMNGTGANAFSLLQGVTRYTTHQMDETSLLYGQGAKYNFQALELVEALR